MSAYQVQRSQKHKEEVWIADYKDCVCFLLQLAREVLDIAAMMVKPGVTTEEIDHAVHLVVLHNLFSLSISYNITK